VGFEPAARSGFYAANSTPKSPEALEVYRHSTAHCWLPRCWNCTRKPNSAWGRLSTTVFITTSSGRRLFAPEDLEKNREKMWELQAQDLPYERKYMPKDEGLKLYSDQPMKVELITEQADAVFSEYTLGRILSIFGRGPHVPSHQKIKAFKLLSIARAYWIRQREERAAAAHATARRSSPERAGRLSGQLEEAKARSPSSGSGTREQLKRLDLFGEARCGPRQNR